MSRSEVYKQRGESVFVPLGMDAVDRTPTRWTGPDALVKPEPWTRLGACLQVDPDMFFPEQGEKITDAKSVCFGCPVRAKCLEYALERGERDGIWGGMSPLQRARIRAKRAARAKADEIRSQGYFV